MKDVANEPSARKNRWTSTPLHPLAKVSKQYHGLVKPFVNGSGVEVMANELDPILGHLPGWYGDRHPNLAGYNVIADETAKYLAKLLREKKAKR